MGLTPPLSNNSAIAGGGIFNDFGVLNVGTSAFSGNTPDNIVNFGGVFNDLGSNPPGTLDKHAEDRSSPSKPGLTDCPADNASYPASQPVTLGDLGAAA